MGNAVFDSAVMPITRLDKQVLQYWRQPKHGVDFFVLDRSLKTESMLTPYQVVVVPLPVAGTE